MNLTKSEIYTYNGEDVEFHYSSSATYFEQTEFVYAVTSVVAGDDYLPLLKDIVFNYTLVTIFTDIDTSNFKNEGEENIDIDKFAEFDEQTGVSAFLKSAIDENVLTALEDSVDCNIAYKTGIWKDSITTAIAELIKSLQKRVAEWDVNIKSEEVSEFIEKFNSSDLNADALVNAYLQTAVHKENVNSYQDTQKADSKRAKKK